MTNVVLDKNIVQWGNQQEMRLSEEIHSALAFSQILPSKDKSKLILEAMKDASMLSMLLRARQTCIYPKLMAAKLASLVQRSYWRTIRPTARRLIVAAKSTLRSRRY